MAKPDPRSHMERIAILAADIEQKIPVSDIHSTTLRADLAGLLVVLMSACYENCVKDIIFSYTNEHHKLFNYYAEGRYEKINSKIRIGDLHELAKTFHSDIGLSFKKILDKRRKKIKDRTGHDILLCYEQILSWRHDFAHAGNRNTTIEEALRTHTLGMRVLMCLNDAFFVKYKRRRKPLAIV